MLPPTVLQTSLNHARLLSSNLAKSTKLLVNSRFQTIYSGMVKIQLDLVLPTFQFGILIVLLLCPVVLFFRKFWLFYELVILQRMKKFFECFYSFFKRNFFKTHIFSKSDTLTFTCSYLSRSKLKNLRKNRKSLK